MPILEPMAQLVNALGRLPGIGARTATRLAYHLLEQPAEDVRQLAEAIWNAKKNIRLCPECFSFTDDSPCPTCNDPKRDRSMICVVTEPRDVAAMERTREYEGLYHVLHGTLSPTDHRGPEQIRLKELVTRLGDGTVKEVILATNPDLEGEATAVYIARLLHPLGVKVTRIAHGVPIGSDLESADEVTLGRAIAGRREM